MCFIFFFFNDTATTEIYTLSLHDALPILNRMADGAVITDLTGHIVAVNPAMERLAGWPENAVAGRPVDFYKLVDARGDRLEQERHAFQETHAAPEPDSMSVFGMALLTK